MTENHDPLDVYTAMMAVEKKTSDVTLAFWADQTVKLWDVQRGSQVRTFSG